jgi:hypothetical protein
MENWLLLHYKLPPEPSALRVHVWRRLKRLGAVLFQDAVWVLPNTARTLEQFRWLAAEIVEMGGEAALWESQPALSNTYDGLVQQFREQADQAYGEILKQLGKRKPDLEALSRQYQQVRQRDYFHSQVGEEVRTVLLSKRGVQP